MLKIYSKGENATIEILGSIGESWFDEGTTLNSVKSQIENLSARNITVKISSLGGDAFEGLAIHDLLKSSKKKVTAEIIGATASAATIIAMGADKVKISENALFLVHNAWTIAQGNADDLKKQAENLETVDNRMAAIYVAKTGKSEEEVRSLMKEDKWIDSNEAKEFGFVDEITEPVKIAASVIQEINNSKELPKIKINKNEFQMTEENKSWFAEQFDAIKAQFKKEEPKAEVEPVQEETISKTEVEEQLNEINAMISELKNSNEELEKQIAEKNAEIEDLNKAVANAKATKVEASAEGNAPDGETTPDASEVTFNAMKSLVKKRRLR